MSFVAQRHCRYLMHHAPCPHHLLVATQRFQADRLGGHRATATRDRAGTDRLVADNLRNGVGLPFACPCAKVRNDIPPLPLHWFCGIIER